MSDLYEGATLSLMSLDALPPGVARPNYTRGRLTPGIVHFGVGNFHRAHLQVYLHRLFEAGRDLDWAVVGAGVTPYDIRMRDALRGQDWLTTVVEQSAKTSSAYVTGVMTDFMPPMDGPAIMARLGDPATRIVSLTVTEGGYFINPATGAFNPDATAIREDAASPDAPRTVFGLILAGLRARRAAGVAPFTVLSCDNIPHNGVVTRNTVAGLADAQDPSLAAWVRAEVAFPNSMVDRIAVATGERERAGVRSDFGVNDAWPVYCEDFIQWVVEDVFPAGRPAFEAAGVTFVSDVTPFEHMKIRILNGGHQIMGYPSGLLGVEFVHDGMRHPVIAGFFRKVEEQEIIPILPPVPGVALTDYLDLIERRFSNPKIADTIRRIGYDGANRQPKFVIPSIVDRLDRGLPVDGLALATALWCRYCAGTADDGTMIEPNDPDWDRLQARARAARADPAAWIAMTDVYGATAAAPVFRDAFAAALRSLWAEGTEATLKRYLGV